MARPEHTRRTARLIAPMTTESRFNWWTCGDFHVGKSKASSDMKDCTGVAPQNSGFTAGNTLTAHVTFPTCWDGVKPNHQPGDVGDTT